MKKDQGVVLVVCLLFTLMVTLLSVVSISMTTLSERAAGNHRDKALAFQSAEAALRVAEKYLSGTPGAFTSAGTGGRYLITEDNTPQAITNAQQGAWNKSAWDSVTAVTCSNTDCFGSANIESQISAAPKYVIEQLPASAVNSSSLVMGKANQTSTKIYRITAEGTGLTSNSYVVLQSIYRKPG